MRICLRLLGCPRLEHGDPPHALDLAPQKGAAVLYYLASRPEQPVARTRLIAMLWEDSDEQEGRNSLSTALSRLRRGVPTAPIVAVADTLVWRPSASADVVWTDVAAFERLTRPGASRDELRQAAALWRGPFLEGFSPDVHECAAWEEWLEVERATWQQRILDTLERAAQAELAAADWSAALGHARQALGIDPLQERFHRLVMHVYERTGERAAALAHYRSAAQTLSRELGVEPDPATQQLYREIMGRSAPVGLRRDADTPKPSAPAPRQRPGLPLVGRQAELARLLAAADDARAGRGRLVLVTGEEGIGKSRLVEELLWRLDGPEIRQLQVGLRWTVAVGACHASERGLPYHPFVDLLSGALASLGSARPVSDIWLAEVARLVPDVVELRPDLPVPVRLDPQQEALRLFEGISRCLGSLPAPRLLILEDLHWADVSSLRLLDYLVHHEALRSTLLVGTVRSEDADDGLIDLLRGLERQRLLERIQLGPLPVEATVQLLREVVREDVRHLGHQLHAETEGNPLFALETIRSLLEAGDLHLGAGARPGPTPLPESVQAAIRARVARLDPDALELARAAAVLGGEVDFDHMRAVAVLDEDRALGTLERLVSSHLLREVPGDVGEALYAFSHDKVRQVIYDDLSSARRRIQHRRALDVLAQPAARTPLERLAYHAMRAQAWDHAVRWCEQAADAALAVFAYPSAASLYEQALEGLERLPLSAGHQAHAILLRLRLAQVALYAAPGRLDEWLVPAERDARQLGDPTLLAHVHLAQASALFIQGRLAEALPLLERIRPTAESTSDPVLRAQFPTVLGQVLALRGEYERAIQALEQAIGLLRAQPQSQLQVTVATEMLGATYAYRGDFLRALDILGTMHAQTESIQDQASLAASHGFLCSVYQMRGDWLEARRSGVLAVETARAAGNVVHEYVGLVFLGLPQARLGDPDTGAETLRRAIAIAQAAGTWVLLGRAHGWLAEVELLRDRPEDALELAEAGLALSHRHGYLFDAALCERARGEALAALGQGFAARAALNAAAAQFAAIGAQPELDRTHAALATLA